MTASAAVVMVGAGAVLAGGHHHPSADPQNLGAITATVTWVSDGDTLRARAADGTDLGRVRLLGIDAPELAPDGRPAQCWSEQARAELDALTPVGSAVTLVTDQGQEDRDIYGRLLRYVEVEGVDVSGRLLAHGAARVRPVPAGRARPVRAEAYAHAAALARREQVGLWSACA